MQSVNQKQKMLLRERHELNEIILRPDVLHRPVDDLPPLDAEVIPGEEFWSRQSMRPDSEGSSFRNAPVLGIGITYENGEATLSVPTVEEYNATVDTHNPGSFHLVPVKGQIDSERFLQLVAKKEFPWSQSRTPIKIGNHYATAKDQFEGREPDIFNPHFFQTNTYEHDLVDHGGIALLDSWEAGKLAFFADMAQQLDEKIDRERMVDILDSLLMAFSEYALLPTKDLTEFQAVYKNQQKLAITRFYKDIERKLSFLNVPVGDPEIFHPNFEAIDATIQRMQYIDDRSDQPHNLGKMAVNSV